MIEQQSIKETLNVIRKALEDEETPNLNTINDNVLMLNKLVKDDGTIDNIENSFLNKAEITNILKDRVEKILDKHLTSWLDRNLPLNLEKYFKNKKI